MSSACGTHSLEKPAAEPIDSGLAGALSHSAGIVGRMTDARDARLSLVAGRQAGTFSFDQALRLGYPRATISRRIRSGAWERVHPGVYAIGGAPESALLPIWAAVLAAGPASVVSHETAALLHGAERLEPRPITLTNPHRWHHAIAGVMVHQIDDLLDSHRTVHRGLPISTPARAVVELGANHGVDLVGRVADDLINARKTTVPAIAAVLTAVARPGKPGVATIAAVLDERSDGYVPPASELERSLFGALEAGGLPRPVRQLPLPGRGTIRGLADGGYLDAQIVLEADGRRWHNRVAAARRDRERDAQAVRAGWVPLRFLHEQIVEDPASVCDVVQETRALRLRQLGRAA